MVKNKKIADDEVTCLRKENTYLKNIITSLPGNIYWKDKKGQYLGCNINVVKLAKLSSVEEVVGKRIADLLGAKIAEPLELIDQEVMESDSERFLEEHGEDIAGNPATYLTRKIPLHDEKGEVIGLLGVSFDITERKKTEKEFYSIKENIKNEEIFSLKEIIALMPGNVYWKDKKGNFLGCNDNVAKILKLPSRHDIVGKNNADFMSLELANKAEAVDNIVMENDEEKIIEEEGFNQIGQPTIYLTRKTPLYDKQKKVVGILGVSLDITDRKKMEEELRIAKEKAEAANRAKSEFLAVASHELRMPLTGILGLAHFLNEGDLSAQEQKEHIQLIMESGKHLLSIVNDVLDFAKLEADKIEITSASVNLKELAEEIVGMLTAPAKSKGLDLYVNYEPHIPHNIQSDSRALRQILVNLVGNAIKFTQAGHVAIKVECLERSPHSVQLKIIVEDTGVGIPEDKLEAVFNRFEQVDSVYTRKQGGTGLGLSITKKLVELMGGTVRVTSEVGKGSAFQVTLSFQLQSEAATELPWTAYAAKVRVLVVDDTTRGAVICKHMGSSNSETVLGKKALEAIITSQQMGRPFDVVIVDRQLQSADPVELIRNIRLQKNIKKPMPIMLVPSSAVIEKHKAHAEGFFDVVVKPVQPIAFQTALTSAWERWIELEQKKKVFPLKVLLVEDDKVVQFVHKKMFLVMGCEVDLAENGHKALELAKTGQHDILFLDVGLPDISGFDVIKAIRQFDNDAAKKPIVALTGYTADDQKQLCLEAGADEVATKPIDIKDLHNILSRYSS